ncbi:MAG: PorT family protein [Muribaculaceae bacterium]|nr:PorT family protein [Muribaculaceae bacterium]
MKKTLITLVIMISAISSYAQGDTGWGIRAAFDINIPSKLGGRLNDEKLDLFRTGYGATIGAVYSYWISDFVFLEPGVSLFYDTYAYKDLIISDEKGKTIEEDPSLYKLGVRIPVVIGYSYNLFDNLPMRVYTGPELSYAFSGSVRIKNKALLDGDEFTLFGKNGFMKPWDCAWKIGLGADFDIATICVEASMGITDIYKDHLSLRDNRVSVSITHYF